MNIDTTNTAQALPANTLNSQQVKPIKQVVQSLTQSQIDSVKGVLSKQAYDLTRFNIVDSLTTKDLTGFVSDSNFYFIDAYKNLTTDTNATYQDMAKLFVEFVDTASNFDYNGQAFHIGKNPATKESREFLFNLTKRDSIKSNNSFCLPDTMLNDSLKSIVDKYKALTPQEQAVAKESFFKGMSLVGELAYDTENMPHIGFGFNKGRFTITATYGVKSLEKSTTEPSETTSVIFPNGIQKQATTDYKTVVKETIEEVAAKLNVRLTKKSGLSLGGGIELIDGNKIYKTETTMSDVNPNGSIDNIVQNKNTVSNSYFNKENFLKLGFSYQLTDKVTVHLGGQSNKKGIVALSYKF